MQFVKPGKTVKKQHAPTASSLDHAQSWEMRVNLKWKLDFSDVVQTTQCLDMVIWSEKDITQESLESRAVKRHRRGI